MTSPKIPSFFLSLAAKQSILSTPTTLNPCRVDKDPQRKLNSDKCDNSMVDYDHSYKPLLRNLELLIENNEDRNRSTAFSNNEDDREKQLLTYPLRVCRSPGGSVRTLLDLSSAPLPAKCFTLLKEFENAHSDAQ